MMAICVASALWAYVNCQGSDPNGQLIMAWALGLHTQCRCRSMLPPLCYHAVVTCPRIFRYPSVLGALWWGSPV